MAIMFVELTLGAPSWRLAVAGRDAASRRPSKGQVGTDVTLRKLVLAGKATRLWEAPSKSSVHECFA